MKLDTMKTAVDILIDQGETVELQYPGTINLHHAGRIYVFGDANPDFGGDAYPNWQAYKKGLPPEAITTPLRSTHDNPVQVAKAITEAVTAYEARQEPRFYVLNETDGILAHPEPMTRDEADHFMIEFRERFEPQGYYASASGRIPISELRLKRIPEAEL
jgi:hypothetical protein